MGQFTSNFFLPIGAIKYKLLNLYLLRGYTLLYLHHTYSNTLNLFSICATSDMVRPKHK